MICITIQGIDYPLELTLDAMDEIEEGTGKTIGEIELAMSSKAARRDLLCTLAAMMRAGAEDGVSTPSADDLRKLLRNPGALLKTIKPVSDAMLAGMRMETEAPDEGEEVDLVLEEIKKKETPDD